MYNVIRKALLALTLAALCVASALADRTADVNAFNESIAAGTVSCQGMIGGINTIYAVYPHGDADARWVMSWTHVVDAAKECAVKAHEEDASLAWFPQSVLTKGCAWLKAIFASKQTEAMKAAGIQYDFRIQISETSWACGWPAPLPAFRTVRGIMPKPQ